LTGLLAILSFAVLPLLWSACSSDDGGVHPVPGLIPDDRVTTWNPGILADDQLGLPLGDDVTRIGSAPDNDIVLAGLSPQHAEIRCESGRYLLYDLGSRRTWVNDAQVAAVHMLKDGFRVQLGQAEFTAQIVS